MPKYNPTNFLDPLHSAGDRGNAVVYVGSVTPAAAIVLSDSVRPCSVAAGTKVHRVVIKNDDLDTGATLAAKIGFIPADGSAQPAGGDAIVKATGVWGQAAATTTYEIFPPYLVEVDSYLDIVVTTAPTGGGVGTVHGKVEGDGVGAA